MPDHIGTESSRASTWPINPQDERVWKGQSVLLVQPSLPVAFTSCSDVKDLYHSEVISTSFEDTRFTSKQINNYVERETHGEIVDLVKDLEEDTDLMLVNYTALHGKWTAHFQAEYTVEEDFYVDEVTTIRVPTVNRLGIFFLNWDEELSCWVLVQQSVGDAMAFFILPDPGKMQQLEGGLTQEHFANILRTTDKRFARIHFPRLSISASYDLRSTLSTLGITRIFSNEADLSGVTEVVAIKLSTGHWVFGTQVTHIYTERLRLSDGTECSGIFHL